jgi:hypothetical protein
MAATYPAAVISLLISAADALDHYQSLGTDQPFFFFIDLLLQLQQGQNPVIVPIKVFGGLIFFSAGSEDGPSMANLFNPSFRLDTGCEISHITGNIYDAGIMRYMD